MIQVERHIIKFGHPEFKKIDSLAFLSKNLYNACLYHIIKHKEESGKWIRYNQLEKQFKLTNNLDYKALPIQSSQQLMMLVDKNLKSYFALLRKFKKDPKSLKGCPKFPHYKHKTKGRNIIVFVGQCQAKLRLDRGIIELPKRSGLSPIHTKVTENLKQVRIIPNSSHYTIEVVYDKPEQILVQPNDKYLSIDLGINNLMTCFDSQDSIGTIINGKPLKSINQYFNKKKGKLQSDLKKKHDRYTSKRTKKLDFKRTNKIKDYLHKSSRLIVNYCLESGISNLVVGYNKEWKQNSNMGKVNNQKFVGIPYATLLQQLEYKCKLVGIIFQEQEESYTSKCSSIDLEELKHQDSYLGKRVKRGLFISKNGVRINADLNGAINILRKNVTANKGQEIVQTLSAIGQVVWPLKIDIS